MDKLEFTDAEENAADQEIKDSVLEHSGWEVSGKMSC